MKSKKWYKKLGIEENSLGKEKFKELHRRKFSKQKKLVSKKNYEAGPMI